MAMFSRRNGIIAASVATILALTAIASASRGGAPDLPTADVTTGPFTDIVEIRGEIRPFKSIVVTAPTDSGQLQIIRLARDGQRVKAGDVLVEFDASTPRRELMERTTELKTAQAQVDQQRAQARITEEANTTAILKADYDVRRAKLDLQGAEFTPAIDVARSRLLLADAERRFIEAGEKLKADKASAEASVATALRRVQRIQMEIDRRNRVLENLQLKAPIDGVVSIMMNPRSGGPTSPPVEFRPGDQAWPGAQIIELPDLSSVHLSARVEEADRGRVQTSQRAQIQVDALPGSDLTATLTDISLLARPDFTVGWPPGRNFDMKIAVDTPDDRLRPGMSAKARVAVGRIEDATLVPAAAVFAVDGQPVVYRLTGRTFARTVIDITRRGREQVAVKGGVKAGDKVALVDPTEKAERGSR